MHRMASPLLWAAAGVQSPVWHERSAIRQHSPGDSPASAKAAQLVICEPPLSSHRECTPRHYELIERLINTMLAAWVPEQNRPNAKGSNSFRLRWPSSPLRGLMGEPTKTCPIRGGHARTAVPYFDSKEALVAALLAERGHAQLDTLAANRLINAAVVLPRLMRAFDETLGANAHMVRFSSRRLMPTRLAGICGDRADLRHAVSKSRADFGKLG